MTPTVFLGDVRWFSFNTAGLHSTQLSSGTIVPFNGHSYDQGTRFSPRDVYLIAKDINPGGLGGYNSFTHVDVQGINRRWGIAYRRSPG